MLRMYHRQNLPLMRIACLLACAAAAAKILSSKRQQAIVAQHVMTMHVAATSRPCDIKTCTSSQLQDLLCCYYARNLCVKQCLTSRELLLGFAVAKTCSDCGTYASAATSGYCGL